MKKKIFIVLCICLFFNFLIVNASTNTNERTTDNLLVPDYIEVSDNNVNDVLLTPAVDATEKVYDFADLFSDSEETSLYSEINSYIDTTNLDLAIVTINSNNKNSTQAYADDFYDYNTFGIGDSHDGLLFLIDMDNREIYITTTGSAISLYTDSRISNILDYVFSFMSDGSYYKGTSSFITLAISYANLDSSKDSRYTINSSGQLVEKGIPIGYILLFALIGTVVIILIMVRMNKMVFKAASSREYLKGNTKKVDVVDDVFLGSHVTKVRIDNDSSGGGIHSGGSGVSHGGGGHKF